MRTCTELRRNLLLSARAVLVWTMALPFHPMRIVQELPRVRQARAAQELDQVGVAVGEADGLGMDRHPATTGARHAMHDDGCCARALRLRPFAAHSTPRSVSGRQ